MILGHIFLFVQQSALTETQGSAQHLPDEVRRDESKSCV
jgi:hypothetical protein